MQSILDDTELWPICEHDNITDNIEGWIIYNGKKSDKEREKNPTTDGLDEDRQTNMELSQHMGWFYRKEVKHPGRCEGPVSMDA